MIEARLVEYAVITAVVIGGVFWLEHRGAESARAEAAEARATQAAADAGKYQQRVDDQAKVAHDATVQADASRAAADAANRALAAERMQRDAYVRAHRGNSAPAGASAPTDDPIGVLATLLGSADDFAGRVAAEADANRIAGDACVRAYEALKP